VAALGGRPRTANEAALGESQHRRKTASARLPASLTACSSSVFSFRFSVFGFQFSVFSVGLLKTEN
jgi:hypothetical protein